MGCGSSKAQDQITVVEMTGADLLRLINGADGANAPTASFAFFGTEPTGLKNTSPSEAGFSPKLCQMYEESVADHLIKFQLLELTLTTRLGPANQRGRTSFVMNCPERILHFVDWNIHTGMQPVITRDKTTTQLVFAGRYRDDMASMMDNLLTKFASLKEIYPNTPELAETTLTWKTIAQAKFFCQAVTKSIARLMGGKLLTFNIPMTQYSNNDDEEVYMCIMNIGGSPYSGHPAAMMKDLICDGLELVGKLPHINANVMLDGLTAVIGAYGYMVTKEHLQTPESVRRFLDLLDVFPSFQNYYMVPGWTSFMIYLPLVDSQRDVILILTRPDAHGRPLLACWRGLVGFRMAA